MSELRIIKISRDNKPVWEVVEASRDSVGIVSVFTSVCSFNNADDAHNFVLKQRLQNGDVENAMDKHYGKEER